VPSDHQRSMAPVATREGLMKTIQAFLCALLLTATLAAGFLGYRAWLLLGDARETIQATTATVEEARAGASAIIVEADDAISAIREFRTTADRQITGMRSDVREIAGKLDEPLAAATETIVELAGVRTDLREAIHDIQPILSNARLISNRLQETSDTLLDCRGNGACLPAQTLALVGSARFTMGQIARSAPEASRAFLGIEKSIHGSAKTFEVGFPIFVNNTNAITGNIATITKPKWWEAPLKAAVAGAVVAGSLK